MAAAVSFAWDFSLSLFYYYYYYYLKKKEKDVSTKFPDRNYYYGSRLSSATLVVSYSSINIKTVLGCFSSIYSEKFFFKDFELRVPCAVSLYFLHNE